MGCDYEVCWNCITVHNYGQKKCPKCGNDLEWNSDAGQAIECCETKFGAIIEKLESRIRELTEWRSEVMSDKPLVNDDPFTEYCVGCTKEIHTIYRRGGKSYCSNCLIDKLESELASLKSKLVDAYHEKVALNWQFHRQLEMGEIAQLGDDYLLPDETEWKPVKKDYYLVKVVADPQYQSHVIFRRNLVAELRKENAGLKAFKNSIEYRLKIHVEAILFKSNEAMDKAMTEAEASDT